MGKSAPKDSSGTVPPSKSQRNAWKRAKKAHGPSVSACICSACGQRAHATANTKHAFCEGIPLAFFEKAPILKGRLTGSSKGEWVTIAEYNEAVVEFSKLNKVIALFTLIESFTPKPEIAKVEPKVVEVIKGKGFIIHAPSAKRKPNHADRSAATRKAA
jgi:hypothetical protein